MTHSAGEVLRVQNLRKSYGDTVALERADLSVHEGQIVALLGRNGAGKSTLLSIVAQLLEADSGSVWINGVDAVAHPDKVTPWVGVAPQETGVYPVLSVRQNLEFFGELAGMSRSERRARAEDVANRLGLAALIDRRASKLSGGEARRLHTACAVMHAPLLLLLDEPTVGADVESRAEVLEMVKGLAADGIGVVYTTHYLQEVEVLEADVVIIDGGKTLARGTQNELIERYQLSGLRAVYDGEFPIDRFDDCKLSEVDVCTWQIEGEIDTEGLLARLGTDAARLESIAILRPDLESVYLAVTGSRLSSNGNGDSGFQRSTKDNKAPSS